jgi:hypothetical protein
MSTELPPSNLLESSNWTMGVGAQKSGEYDELLRAVAHVYLDERVIYGDMAGSGPVYESYDEWGEDSTREWDAFGGELLLRSKIFTRANDQGKIAMLRAWRGDAQWVYGLAHSGDGLWEQDVATRKISFDRMSGYVLSGLLGEGLLQENKPLRRLAKEFEMTALDRAILVGGAALAAQSVRRTGYLGGGTYLGIEDDGMQYETWTGGDINGDFRTARFVRPIGNVTTTLDMQRAHAFMPVPGLESRVSAYHSAEERIITALLTHLVNKVGGDSAAIHAEIMQKLSGEKIHYGGAFGEYDSSDGGLEANMLRRLLAHPELTANKEELLDNPVLPYSKYRFKIVSREEGALLMNTDGDNEETQSMLVPNEEIPEYIATLVRGGGGRTGPRAMLNVIHALLPEDAV